MLPIIQTKHGVKIDKLTPQAIWGMMVVASCMARMGYDFVLTSGSEGTHKANSLHYLGRAFDFRTKNILDGHMAEVFRIIRDSLGPEWDVIAETDHGHCEWDPDYLKGQLKSQPSV